jgi:hypothetical protein
MTGNHVGPPKPKLFALKKRPPLYTSSIALLMKMYGKLCKQPSSFAMAEPCVSGSGRAVRAVAARRPVPANGLLQRLA